MTYTKITYPDSFRETAGIGVTAPSSGLGNEIFVKRFELVAKQLSKRGYEILEGKCLRSNVKHVSALAQERVDDLLRLWLNDKVGAIIPPWGGEILIEMLELLDIEKMVKSKPKWLLGYSDCSTLLLALTIKTGLATAHGINFMDMIDSQEDPLSKNALHYLKTKPGESFIQNSSDKFQKQFVNFSDNLETAYNLTEKTEWKSLNGDTHIQFSGRLIGGCIDVITHLVGTPFGNVDYFKETFSSEGTILYLENCQLSPCKLTRYLTQMKLAGWLTNLNGILIGRSAAKEVEDSNSLTYLEVLQNVLSDLDCPVIYDADIGHMPPNMTLINGAFAEVEFENGTAVLKQTFV